MQDSQYCYHKSAVAQDKQALMHVALTSAYTDSVICEMAM